MTRPVQVFKYEHRKEADGSPGLQKVDYGTAVFHEFGVQNDANGGNYSTAIIERENGQVEIVGAAFIKFIDKPENTGKG